MKHISKKDITQQVKKTDKSKQSHLTHADKQHTHAGITLKTRDKEIVYLKKLRQENPKQFLKTLTHILDGE